MSRRKKFDWKEFWLFYFFYRLFTGGWRYRGRCKKLSWGEELILDLLTLFCLAGAIAAFECLVERRQQRRVEKALGSGENATRKETAKKQSKTVQERPASHAKAFESTVSDIGLTERTAPTPRVPVHTMPTEAERRAELAWKAKQELLEQERRQEQESEENRRMQAWSARRAELTQQMQAICAEMEDAPAGEAQCPPEENAAITYCGKLYVSWLTSFDDPEQALAIDAPEGEFQYSISWGGLPERVREILREYCSVGGTLRACTRPEWVHEGDNAMWIDLYLN